MDAAFFIALGLVCVLVVLRLNLEERGWGVLLLAAAAVFFIAALIYLL